MFLIFLKKNFWEDSSYRATFLLKIIRIFFTIIFFYYFSKFIDKNIKNYTLFQFIFSGHLFYEFFLKYLKQPGGFIITEQYKGTLELLLNSKTSPFLILIYSSLYSILFDIIMIFIYLSLGVFLFNIEINLSFTTFILLLLLLLLTMIYILSLGIIGAGISFILKKSDPFTSFLRYLFILMGGLYFPYDILPDFIKKLMIFFPIREIMNNLRLLLYDGKFLYFDFIKLFMHSLILLILSFFIFKSFISISKKNNQFSTY